MVSLGIDQSSLEPYSLGRPPVNIHSLVTSNSDPTPKLDHTTEEQITHGENASLENTVSLMTKEQGATASYLPEGIIGDKSEQEKSFRELGELYLISPGESSFESVQITHFPVGTNSCTKTTTVKSPVLKNSQRSKSSCGFSPFTFRSGSFTERTQKMSLENQKTRSPSCANDCLVNKSDNTRQERPGNSFKRQLIHPATTQRAHAAEGLFDATSYKSGQVLASNFSPNLGRAKSFESMIDNTRSKLDSSAHGGLDLFQRHSSALKEGQLNVHCNWYSSEPDLTRTSPCRSPPGNSEPHSEPSKGKKRQETYPGERTPITLLSIGLLEVTLSLALIAFVSTSGRSPSEGLQVPKKHAFYDRFNLGTTTHSELFTRSKIR